MLVFLEIIPFHKLCHSTVLVHGDVSCRAALSIANFFIQRHVDCRKSRLVFMQHLVLTKGWIRKDVEQSAQCPWLPCFCSTSCRILERLNGQRAKQGSCCSCPYQHNRSSALTLL